MSLFYKTVVQRLEATLPRRWTPILGEIWWCDFCKKDWVSVKKTEMRGRDATWVKHFCPRCDRKIE